MKDKISAYSRMLLIRHFEEAVERLFSEGRIVGTAHTCIGQEAIAVGVATALGPQDALTSTHRGHGHFIARGAEPGRVMAELFGRATGYSRGRGGSQMMMEPAIGFYGTNGITGASVAFAAGLALNARMNRTGRVVATLFGDGAANQGIIYETLNIASLWHLPLIAICENNGYAMSTPVKTGVSVPSLSARAAGFGMPGESIDGNDVEEVFEAVTRLAERARRGEGPALLECRTYRLAGHSRGDPRVYRTREEEQEAWTREPIVRFEKRLRDEGLLDDASAAEAEAAATTAIEEAIRFAENSPMADVASVTEGVFA